MSEEFVCVCVGSSSAAGISIGDYGHVKNDYRNHLEVGSRNGPAAAPAILRSESRASPKGTVARA